MCPIGVDPALEAARVQPARIVDVWTTGTVVVPPAVAEPGPSNAQPAHLGGDAVGHRKLGIEGQYEVSDAGALSGNRLVHHRHDSGRRVCSRQAVAIGTLEPHRDGDVAEVAIAERKRAHVAAARREVDAVREASGGDPVGIVCRDVDAAVETALVVRRHPDQELGGLPFLEDVAELLRIHDDHRVRPNPGRQPHEQARQDDAAYGGRCASSLARSHAPGRRRDAGSPGARGQSLGFVAG